MATILDTTGHPRDLTADDLNSAPAAPAVTAVGAAGTAAVKAAPGSVFAVVTDIAGSYLTDGGVDVWGPLAANTPHVFTRPLKFSTNIGVRNPGAAAKVAVQFA